MDVHATTTSAHPPAAAERDLSARRPRSPRKRGSPLEGEQPDYQGSTEVNQSNVGEFVGAIRPATTVEGNGRPTIADTESSVFATTPARSPPEASLSASSAASPWSVRHLSHELDVVRRAWQAEGQALRDRMADLHRSRVQAEERAFEAESELRQTQRDAQAREDEIATERAKERAVREEERRGWEHELASLQATVKEARDESAAQAQEVRELRAALLRSQNECDSLRRRMGTVESQVVDRAEAMARYSDQIHRLEVILEEERHAADEHQQRLRGELQQARAEVSQLREELRDRQSALDQAEHTWQEERNSRESHFGDMRRSLQSEVDRLRHQLGVTEREREEAVAEVRELRRLLRDAESEFAAVAQTVDDIAHEQRVSPGRSPLRTASRRASPAGGFSARRFS